jgi:hypothetical protein
MKNNDKKTSRATPRITSKVGVLAALMFLSAIKGWSAEQWAFVLRQMEQPHDNTITTVLLDKNKDGLPDSQLALFDTNMSLISIVLKDLLQRGVEISFDDSGKITLPGGMDEIWVMNLLTVDGRDILDLFPNMEYAFPFAASRRAAAQQAQRGGR